MHSVIWPLPASPESSMTLTFHLHLSSMKLVIVPKMDHDLSYFRVYTYFPFSRRSRPILLFLEKFMAHYRYQALCSVAEIHWSRGPTICHCQWASPFLALPGPPLCPGKLTHVAYISGSLVL